MTMSFFQDEQDTVFYNMGNIYLLFSENLIMRFARSIGFHFVLLKSTLSKNLFVLL